MKQPKLVVEKPKHSEGVVVCERHVPCHEHAKPIPYSSFFLCFSQCSKQKTMNEYEYEIT